MFNTHLNLTISLVLHALQLPSRHPELELELEHPELELQLKHPELELKSLINSNNYDAHMYTDQGPKTWSHYF